MKILAIVSAGTVVLSGFASPIFASTAEFDRQFTFFDEPVHSEVEDHSEEGLWRATSSWNDQGLLVSLILTCRAKHSEGIVTVMPR